MYKIKSTRGLFSILLAVVMMISPTFVAEHENDSSLIGFRFVDQSALASEGGGGGGFDVGIRNPRKRKPATRFRLPGFGSGLSNTQTSRATRVLQQGRASCGRLAREYRADCLAQVFQQAASKLTSPAYAPAKAQLKSASRRIRSQVSRNLDRSKPTIRRSGRRIRAVKRSAVRTVNASAAKIIRETETKLIRSAGASRERKIHFTRIAKVAGSTKVILRS